MASELRVNTLKDAAGNNSVAMQYVAEGSAKAWVQTASGAAPSDSLNISGVVDNSTGNYTASFSNSMSNDDYSPTAAKITGGAGRDVGYASIATSNMVLYSTTASDVEDATCFGTVHGDLA